MRSKRRKSRHRSGDPYAMGAWARVFHESRDANPFPAHCEGGKLWVLGWDESADLLPGDLAAIKLPRHLKRKRRAKLEAA